MPIQIKYLYLDLLICAMTSFLLLSIDNSLENLPYVGCNLVFIGFYQVFKASGNKFLTYLFAVIGIINVSIGVYDMLFGGLGVSEWQTTMLRSSEYNVVTAKSILLFNTVLSLFVSGDACKDNNEIDNINNMRITNIVAATLITVVLFLILGYGLLTEIPRLFVMQHYESVGNPVFEYSVLLYILAWLCSKNGKIINVVLMAYAIVFSIAFLLVGDRSSVSMYIIFFLITHYKGRLSFGKVVCFACGAVIFFNVIAILRHNGVGMIAQFFRELLNRGLYQDTASWAYYSSISIIAAADAFGDKMMLFTSFLLSLIGFSDEYSALPVFARTYSNSFYNCGGGFLPTYFYAWLGYFGVIIIALIVGLLIKILFNRHQGIGFFYKFLMIVFCIRWYVYAPINLFRSVFLIGGMAYLIYKFIVKLTSKDY